MLRLSVVILAVALCSASPADATSYPPVTFNELVTHADVIFIGEVVDVRPFPLDTRDGTVVKTRVIFRVFDPIFGTTGIQEIFDFFGGEWNGIRMAIAGMPQFAVGDRRVVFARRDRSINPIVGFTQGLFRISRDSAGVDRVFTSEGVPLGQPESIGSTPPSGAVETISAMRLSEFRDRISGALAAAKRR